MSHRTASLLSSLAVAVLASNGVDFTTGIAVDANNVYWTQTGPTGGAHQCAKAACATTLVTLAARRNGVEGIAVAVDATHLAFADLSESQTGGRIVVFAK